MLRGDTAPGYPRDGWRPEDAVRAILADLTAGGAPPRLDVVVATHRHQDHVSGFASPLWAAVASVHPVRAWPEIPREPLLETLRTRAERVVRSDRPDPGLQGTQVRPGIGIDFQVPC